jgi:large subunit ribosomal protein L13
MKSFMAKKDQCEAKWLLVDADNAVLGRMAAKIAPLLMGKTKPTYTPHVDTGDHVIVINADQGQAVRLLHALPRRPQICQLQ